MLRFLLSTRLTLPFIVATVAAAQPPLAAPAQTAITLEPRLIHLRSDSVREWSSFPEQAFGSYLEVRFAAATNEHEYSLCLRQHDVKQPWRVLLNGQRLGELVRDESDMVVYLPIPRGALTHGDNVVRVECLARGAQASDDIYVGQLAIEPRPVMELLSQSTLQIDVVEAASGEPLPARITIVNADRSLQTTGNISNDHLAVRPGVIYTSDGKARIGLPPGTYTVYAGRGFEYSLDKTEVTVSPLEGAQRTLKLRREVATPGYVACDTHIHTFTHSGHGDASMSERMITLAGECIELPIATDHNKHIDYQAHAEQLNVRQFFTPVIGNEVTTSVGHFNVFPVATSSRIPDFKLKEWGAIFDEIFGTPGVKIAILNHARDIHSGTRPFGPLLFNAAIGENLEGWPTRFNAMEVINSGATQTDPMRLLHDWMALLNRGYSVTPVGSSDSHDVARYIVGQGRTYIRCDDADVANVNVDEAVESFLAGRVLVSYGLLVEMTVQGQFKSGESVPVTDDDVEVALSVRAPHWIDADRVQLYANGQLIREETIASSATGTEPLGVKWQAKWKIPRPGHDVHLVAIALGPGVTGPYWRTAKPYQPTSPDWQPYVLGITGAIWLDADGDGRRSSARHDAERIVAASAGDLKTLVSALAAYDSATAAQAAHLLHTSARLTDRKALEELLGTAPHHVQDGFRAYQQACRETDRARLAP